MLQSHHHRLCHCSHCWSQSFVQCWYWSVGLFCAWRGGKCEIGLLVPLQVSSVVDEEGNEVSRRVWLEVGLLKCWCQHTLGRFLSYGSYWKGLPILLWVLWFHSLFSFYPLSLFHINILFPAGWKYDALGGGMVLQVGAPPWMLLFVACSTCSLSGSSELCSVPSSPLGRISGIFHLYPTAEKGSGTVSVPEFLRMWWRLLETRVEWLETPLLNICMLSFWEWGMGLGMMLPVLPALFSSFFTSGKGQGSGKAPRLSRSKGLGCPEMFLWVVCWSPKEHAHLSHSWQGHS